MKLKLHAMPKRASQKGETNMKIIMRSSICLPFAVVLLTAALAGPAAAAEKPVPFSGSLQGREIDTVQPPSTLQVDGSGTGIATHIGQFTVTWVDTVNLVNNLGVGSIHLIGANGDSILATTVGQAEPTGTPGVFRVVEIMTITGGTGRFANAQGSFTLERLVDLNTGLTSGSFHGTITSPGSAN
jgi:hypothetical protein